MAYTNFQNCTAQEYNEIIYSGDAKHKLKLLFNNIEYTNANTKTESVKIKSKILSDGGDRFSLDNFKSKQVELIIHDIDLDDIIAPVSISIGTLVDEENDTYEYVPIGIFNIDETPTTDTGKTTIKLIDNSVKFDVPYDAEPIITANGGSATMLQILQDICTKCGVTLGTQTFVNYNTTVSVWDNSITARQYVMYISEKAGCIATIDRLGRLIFVDVNLGEYKNIISNENIIYINDALNRKIKDVKLLGNTEQKTTQGTNLFDYSKWYENRNNIEVSQGDITINENSIVFNNPTATDQYNRNTWHMVSTPTESSRNIMEKFGIEIEPSTKYTISYKFNNYSQVFIFFYNEDGAFISLANSAIWQPPSFSPKLIYSFTTPSNAKYLCVRFDNESYNKGLEDTSLTITNIMLAKGTNSEYEEFTNGTSPNPDYPQDIETTTGLQEIKLQNKNFYQKDGDGYLNNQSISTTNGNGYPDENSFITNYMYIKGFNEITLNGSSASNGRIWGALYDKNKNFIEGISNTGQNPTLTISNDNAVYLRLGILNEYKETLQVEPGEEQTTYIAHQEQNFELNLGNIELCKIGTYQDYIYKSNGNWYIHKEIEKTVLNGSEDWLTNTSNGRTFMLNMTYPNRVGKSNRFNYSNEVSLESKNVFYFGNQQINFVNPKVNNTLINTLEDWKLYLKEQYDNSIPVLVYHILSTPTNTLITDTTLIEQLDSLSNATLYDEINYITIDGNLSATLDLTYASENKPIEIDPLLIEQYEAGELLKISRVVYEDAIRKFDYGSDDYGTLYINSANPYIVDNTEVSNIYDSIKDFEIYSMNISKMLGNPAIDPWDIIQFTYNNKTYKTLGQNTLTYNGVMLQQFDTQIGTNAKTQENVTLNAPESKFRKVSTEINQLNGSITMIAGEVGQYDNRITKVEQDIDSIEQSVEVFENLKRNVISTNYLHITDAVSNYPLRFSIKNARQIFPSETLYPSDSLYPKGSYLIIDKTLELSDDAKMIKLPPLHLKVKNGIYDEMVIEKNTIYVIHRIGMNQDGTTYILENETIENLGTIDIVLFDNENYIYLYSFKNESVIYELDYTTHSLFTDVFATEVYVNSEIEQTTNQILLQVNEKVDEDEIIAKLNVAVENGQGIINLVGNTVTIDSDKFKLDAEGNITCNDSVMNNSTMNSATMNNVEVHNGNILLESNRPTSSPYTPPKVIRVYDKNYPERYITISSNQINIHGDSYYTQTSPGQIVINEINGTGSTLVTANNGLEVSKNGLYSYVHYNEISTPGSVSASSFINTSLETTKKNFKKLNNATDIIKNTDIYSYNWKNETNKDKKHYGLVIGDKYNTPEEFMSEDKKGIDIYATVSICLQAIKEQQEQIELLQKEIKLLKEEK